MFAWFVVIGAGETGAAAASRLPLLDACVDAAAVADDDDDDADADDDADVCPMRSFRCLMAISMISVFSMRPRPFFM